MSDNKKKQGRQDDNLIAFNQKYELYFAVNELKRDFPKKTEQEAKKALIKAIKKVSPSEGRKKIMLQAKKNLRGH